MLFVYFAVGFILYKIIVSIIDKIYSNSHLHIDKRKKTIISLLKNITKYLLLIVFGLGVMIGILSTIKIIRHFLETARPQMIYLILGLMIGSLYAVFMGPTTLEVAKPAMNLSTFNFVYFIIGGAILLGLEKGKDLLEKRAK